MSDPVTIRPALPADVPALTELIHRSARQLPFDDGKTFVYSAEDRARLEEIAKRYPPAGRKSAILPALYLVQRAEGYISLSAVKIGRAHV